MDALARAQVGVREVPGDIAGPIDLGRRGAGLTAADVVSGPPWIRAVGNNEDPPRANQAKRADQSTDEMRP